MLLFGLEKNILGGFIAIVYTVLSKNLFFKDLFLSFEIIPILNIFIVLRIEFYRFLGATKGVFT